MVLAIPFFGVASGRSIQDGATYRQLLDQGVALLGDGEYVQAVERFEAAGRCAPDAVLWHLYLRRAHEEEGAAPVWPEPTPTPVMDRFPWDPVAITVLGSTRTAQLAATGERLLSYFSGEAALVDVDSGRLVARLRPRFESVNSQARWAFDTSGRAVIAAGGRFGRGVGLDVRDALTGRPIEVVGALEFNVTPGARYEWFAAGEEPPACDYPATVDLGSADGILRCHSVPQADGHHEGRTLGASLSSDGSLAMLRDQANPTTVRVIDRESDEIILERSPAGWRSWFSPTNDGIYVESQETVTKIDLASGEPVWEVPMAPVVANAVNNAALIFRGDEFMEVAPTGVVSVFDDKTGTRREVQRLVPAPKGPIYGAKLARSGTLVIIADAEGTCCYRMGSGERLWRRGVVTYFRDPTMGTVDEAERRCMVQLERHRVGVVALETGEPLGDLGAAMVPIEHVTLVENEDAAIVTLAGGELRRVELATGATSARVRAAAGSLLVRDPESLEPTRGAALEVGASVQAFSEDERYAVTTRLDPPRTRLVRLTEDLAGQVVREFDRSWAVVAFSPSGDSVALAGGGRWARLDALTGETRVEGALLEGKELSVAAFHGEGVLMVGEEGHGFDVPGAWAVDATDGRVIKALDVPGPGLGCSVMQIHSDQAAGVVVLTTSGYTTVMAFEDGGWGLEWSQGLDGGNYGTFMLRQAEGSRLACVSGPPGRSRVFDVTTGEIIENEKTLGVMDLALTRSGRFLVGRIAQRLTVMDGESFETLYSREEDSAGNAWILEDGSRRSASATVTAPKDPAHLIRDGWSAPISSFDAWLYDPLKLRKAPYKRLPRLPVILGLRSVEANDGSRTLAITASADEPLIGLVFENTTGRQRFVAVPERRRVEGPPGPLVVEEPRGFWASVRLVARSGVMSRPALRP